MPKILLIEDDDILTDQLTHFLKGKDYAVETCDDGLEAVERIECYKYDLIIIDWGLPGLSGVEIVKRFRASGGVTPILMLTGKNKVEEKEFGFNAGADDYLTKPFDARELHVRAQALLRRPPEFRGSRLEASGLVVDTTEHRAYFGNSALNLQPKEFQLLEFLVRHNGKTVKTKDLLDYVWSSDSDVTSETLYTYIRAVRKKIEGAGGDAGLVATVHGIGYTIRSDSPAK